MSAPRGRIFWLMALWAAGRVLLAPLGAQEATASSPPPSPKSPVESFRALLAQTPQERRQSIADRPPEVQKLILAKIREYLSLKPEERETRLWATELRWYLLPLMNAPATNRAAQLAIIPPVPRQLIQDRIAQWDRLPPQTQKELLDNELTYRYFTQFELSSPEQKTNLLAGVSPEHLAQLEAGMDRWRGLSEDQRRKTCEHFDRFFELTPAEKQKALDPFSEAERQQMEKTLSAFEKLSKTEREQCVRSFEKFANLSLAEREQFLKNAERWRLMSPAERQAWRNLVDKVPDLPPMPPGFPPPLPPGESPPPLPPEPPPSPPESSQTVTNSAH